MFLMGYMVIFFIVLVVSIINLGTSKTLFEIGMNHQLQNIVIIVFSFLAIVRVLIEIIRIESHSEYDKKLRAGLRN